MRSFPNRLPLSPAVRKRRSVMVIKRDFSRRMLVSAAAMERRRAALLRTRLRRFGSGDWDRLYTGIGPSRTLVGRPVAGRVVNVKGPRGRIAGRGAFESVGRSLVAPTQIAGSVASGSGNDTRPIAVAVNGTIEATGETFHLKLDDLKSTRHGESFSVMVPESSMRAGRNVVEVFEIVGGGKLRLLARS
jgi:hypothetical protein